jgi:hypothetical protein
MPATLLLALLASLTASAQVQFVPDECAMILNPGDTVVVDVTVVIPAFTTFKEIDVYLLADNTGSMSPIIQDVADEARQLVDEAFGLLDHPKLRIGVGQYQDYPFVDPPYSNLLDPTSTLVDVKAAIDSWFASGGGDGSEAQLFALREVTEADNVAYSDIAKRVVFWFGDAPGHDPVCDTYTGDESVTEESAIATLNAAGPGGTQVLVANVNSGAFVDGLDDDPQFSANNYVGACTIGGTPGQATRVAGGTDGNIVVVSDPTLTAEALQGVWTQFLRRVEVTLEPSPLIAPYLVSVSPPAYDVNVPTNPVEPVELTFQLTFAAEGCVENASILDGTVKVLFDGALAQGSAKRVQIAQPACDTQCLLLVGVDPLDMVVGQTFPGVTDHLYVNPLLYLPVTMEDIPALAIPDNPVLTGLHVYTQVYLYNTFDFPGDPVKMSNALDFEIGGGAALLGIASGMEAWAAGPAEVGGEIQVGFTIDGFGTDD